jgi:hypothetical protein
MHLEGIEVTWEAVQFSDLSLPTMVLWDQENVTRLEENHPSLRKVYYINRGQPMAVMWERTDCWRERAVRVLYDIDMIGGDFDKL